MECPHIPEIKNVLDTMTESAANNNIVGGLNNSNHSITSLYNPSSWSCTECGTTDSVW
eukprot:Pgem_evm1s14442